MICDKCKKKFTEDWIPGKNYPKYEITETTGLSEYARINLCYECSKMFLAWLDDDGLKHYDDGSTEP